MYFVYFYDVWIYIIYIYIYIYIYISRHIMNHLGELGSDFLSTILVLGCFLVFPRCKMKSQKDWTGIPGSFL